MSPRPVFLACIAASLVTCGDDPVTYAELGEVCGAPGPFRVLELGPDEVARSSETLRVQDRVVYVVSKLNTSDTPSSTSPTDESSVWAAGPCGESPVKLASGIDDIFILPAWPDLVLSCEKSTGDVLLLDPTGAEAPRVVFSPGLDEFYGCGFRWTDFGLLSLDKYDEDLAALVLHPFPADPHTELAAPEVLLDPIRLTPGNLNGAGIVGNVLYAYPTEVLARTPEDELIRVDLADRSRSILQVEVAGLDVSPDGQHLLWQHSGVTNTDPERPEGQVYYRDRATNVDVILAATSLQYNGGSLRWVDRGLIELNVGISAMKRLFILPTFDQIEIPANFSLRAQLSDGRWLGTSIFTSYLETLDLRTGETARLFPREAQLFRSEENAIQVLQVPQCCIKSDRRDEGPLWRVPLDGSPRTMLARRATRAMKPLDDGRFVGPVDTDARWLAALVLAGPDAELRIDDAVHYDSIDTTQTATDGLVRYSVADGERSGVYLARLPPPP